MSEQKSKQLCRFCQREMRVLFYCEDCGVTCCSDCLRDDFVDDAHGFRPQAGRGAILM